MVDVDVPLPLGSVLPDVPTEEEIMLRTEDINDGGKGASVF